MAIVIDIAAAIKAGLAAVVPAGTTVFADGVKDDALAASDAISFPSVAIIVSECAPHGYRSKLRTYPVIIEAATWYPDDKWQETLYALTEKITTYLCGPPSLSISSATIDAFFFDSPPIRATEGRLQSVQWQGTVNAKVT